MTNATNNHADAGIILNDIEEMLAAMRPTDFIATERVTAHRIAAAKDRLEWEVINERLFNQERPAREADDLLRSVIAMKNHIERHTLSVLGQKINDGEYEACRVGVPYELCEQLGWVLKAEWSGSSRNIPVRIRWTHKRLQKAVSVDAYGAQFVATLTDGRTRSASGMGRSLRSALYELDSTSAKIAKRDVVAEQM
jgi:hypothetical protein